MARLHFFLLGLLAACNVFVGASPALESRDLLGEIIDALGIGLVTHIDVTLTTATLSNNLVTIDFDAQNPLLFELTVDSVNAAAGLNGTNLASFQHTFDPHAVVVPPLGKANSGNITNVLLTQGVTNSLNFVPFGVLDLTSVSVNVRAGSILGIGGIPLVISGLHQTSVPTTYTLDI
ncbi:hypothetical protein FB45DRAFT_1034278 [Roridomyces roridus]|uniref:Uncharacterized protein n=1 Tax=Roridomyces roridus TaxID=1738132 RepID=A0AAD7BE67_9AGAR|nr:hypothetical protein FB45DRAFT_1034278 [Roridomyces roridus]